MIIYNIFIFTDTLHIYFCFIFTCMNYNDFTISDNVISIKKLSDPKLLNTQYLLIKHIYSSQYPLIIITHADANIHTP